MRKRAIEAKANITEDCLRSIKLVLERTLIENESLRKKLEAVTIENNDLRSEINARINQRKYDYSRCSDCPCFDLINRQQTEIERLRKANGLLEYVTKAVHHVKIGGEDWMIDFKTKEAMFEEINKKIDTLCNIQTSRAEAIKKFWSRLQGIAYRSEVEWSHGEHPMLIELDDAEEIYEEMVGDAE